MSSYGCWVTFEWVGGHPGEWRVVFVLCRSVALLSLMAAAWPCSYEILTIEATWRLLYPSASKTIIEPFFSSLKTFLFNSFGMFNSHFFFFNYFWGTTTTVSAIQLVLLQEKSDDHSTVFYTFLHWIRFGSGHHLISTSLRGIRSACIGIQQTVFTSKDADFAEFGVVSSFFPELYIYIYEKYCTLLILVVCTLMVECTYCKSLWIKAYAQWNVM